MSSPAPAMPKSWQWLLRITGLVAMLLFLTPTAYVVKYYAVDLPREKSIAQGNPIAGWNNERFAPDDLLAEEQAARTSPSFPARLLAVDDIGYTLLEPHIGWKRPLECLSAKATLAELATRDPNPRVRAFASEELGKVAQNGAVIRR